VGTLFLGLAETSSAAGALACFALGAFLGGYALSHGYIQANSSNLLWNSTRLGTVRFESDLKTADLAWLYFSNAISIIASAGLLTPWAIIRTIKYRASNMRVCYGDDLAIFEGSQSTSVQAAGVEIGQIFDLDLSL
jgi:uncharacterized membrane protein YjgN (DUF898 family)